MRLSFSFPALVFTSWMASEVEAISSEGSSEVPCDEQCRSAYGQDDDAELTPLQELCVDSCVNTPEMFAVDYPYLFGPLTIESYPELTNVDPEELKNMTGELWVRVNQDRNKMQFYYTMDTNPTPFFPYFGMHLHAGNLVPEEIGGHIIVSIAGAGSLIGCLAPHPETGDILLCSDECTPGSEERGNCINSASLPPPPPLPNLRQPGLSSEVTSPNENGCPICHVEFGGAYFCRGGCQGDGRISGYDMEGPNPMGAASDLPQAQTVVPSRACDIDNPDNPSNPVQESWITGLHSVEFSGNETDGIHYSPFSIGIEDNFDLWCGEDLPFLYDYVLQPGAASYVALHGNFNATGFATLAYGDAFAALSTSEGGPQNCTIFGHANYSCTDGIPGYLDPIDMDPLANVTNTTMVDDIMDMETMADDMDMEEDTAVSKAGDLGSFDVFDRRN